MEEEKIIKFSKIVLNLADELRAKDKDKYHVLLKSLSPLLQAPGNYSRNISIQGLADDDSEKLLSHIEYIHGYSKRCAQKVYRDLEDLELKRELIDSYTKMLNALKAEEYLNYNFYMFKQFEAILNYRLKHFKDGASFKSYYEKKKDSLPEKINMNFTWNREVKPLNLSLKECASKTDLSFFEKSNLLDYSSNFSLSNRERYLYQFLRIIRDNRNEYAHGGSQGKSNEESAVYYRKFGLEYLKRYVKLINAELDC